MDQSAEYLRQTISRAAVKLRKCCAEAMDDEAGQFTKTQRRIIELIYGMSRRRDQGCSVKQLADELHISSAAVSEMLMPLVERKVVERKVNSHDRRSVALNLVPEWQQKFLLAEHQFNLLLSEFIGNLSENERMTVIRCAEKLRLFADEKLSTGNIVS